MAKKKVNNLDELKSAIDTMREMGNSLVPQIDELIIDFEITLPISFSSEEHRQKFPGATNDSIVFDKCQFLKKVQFRNSPLNFYFENCDFNRIDAKDQSFEGKIRFRDCNFNSVVNFRNTKFLNLTDFWRCVFHQKTIFYKTDFMNTVVFSAATFKENVLFTYTLIEKLIIFRGTKIDKGIDLSLAILSGELSVFDFKLINYNAIEINKIVKDELKDRIFESEVEKARAYKKVYENKYEKSVSEDAEIPVINKRETYRIIKKYHESESNIIESLPFKILEKETLRIELLQKEKNINNYIDRFILWITKKSNNYGISVKRGFVFIVLVGWVFFYISLIATENYTISLNPLEWEFQKGLEYFIQYLVPTHKFNYLGESVKLTPLFYISDFIGRSFVGFGIYQFIQAFRKFR